MMHYFIITLSNIIPYLCVFFFNMDYLCMQMCIFIPEAVPSCNGSVSLIIRNKINVLVFHVEQR